MDVAFNPEPLEFYRYLNRKTKRVATNAYFDALSFVLTLSESIPKERMALFQEIQNKWNFNKDWCVYVAEKSASISVMACHNIQRSYNREVSYHSLVNEKNVPASVFYKKAMVVVFEDESKESGSEEGPVKDGQKAEVTFEDESEAYEDESEGSENDDQNNQNPFIAIDWHEWLERILEVSKELPIYKK
ncbi:15063_t:CDS:2 [Funneliformis geosporum]|nr:15063_t:CDS:2 [Funneliformis geosporum]